MPRDDLILPSAAGTRLTELGRRRQL